MNNRKNKYVDNLIVIKYNLIIKNLNVDEQKRRLISYITKFSSK